MKEYALYKGEELLAMGTATEIARQMGVSEKTIRFYSAGAYKKRLEKRKNKNARVVVLLDDEEDK